ncbi:MAG: hypothetical protein RSA95_07195 [Citrobacter sp.]|uniref:hypothetical protein n=1 Tax=Citrobacter sp. TaxID=1896336 RepID=UPI002FCBEC19
MTYLRDMEELISSINDINMQNYMREALRCYMTGAHRACIIMSFITIHENIYTKLDRLALVNSKAKKIFDEITPTKENQAVFEKEMVDKLAKENIITKLDASFIEILGKLRNKSAHPSGHSPSAEESRYVFSEAITRFLSKPILSANQVSDEILESLGGGNLFPTLKISDHATIVKHELTRLAPEGLPYLLNKLLHSLDDTNNIISKNAQKFILGMSYECSDEYILSSIRKIIIEKQIHKTEREECIALLVSCNYHLLENLSDPTYIRLNEVIIKNCKNNGHNLALNKIKHPINIIKSITKIEPKTSQKKFEKATKVTVEKFKYNTELYNIIQDCDWIKNQLFKCLLNAAKSHDFETANDFAKFAIDADNEISGTFTEKQCFGLLAGIYKAKLNNAHDSKAIVVNKYNSIPKTKEKALNVVHKEKESCQSLLRKIVDDNSLLIDDLITIE